ncbi:MAG: Eco57I restriction-modification methylase domain-containing protein [Dermatophilaceae bacterium]
MSAEFTTVRTVGGLLPPDLLGRVIAGAQNIDGLAPADFHLPSGETPREAANRAWSYLRGVWATFAGERAKLREDDPAVGFTRDRWLSHLFRELDYGRLTPTPAGGLDAGDKAFPISHVWGCTLIHLLGWGVELDRRTKGVPGAAERAPHAMVQELLNRTDDYLWALLSNGRILRLLRDTTSLAGASYVEFDLEAMFDGEVFSDFVLLYLLTHQSRVEILADGGPASDCWLERWRTNAIESGTRALTLLRDGVQAAIQAFGTGFARHPANTHLRAQLDSGALSLDDYHRALLRLVYRLLFLFVAEDRDALHPPGADPTATARYATYFSTARLRRLSLRRRGTTHGDLWLALSLVLQALGREDGHPQLALPGLGGLFDPSAVDVLAGAQLANDALLTAIRHLCVVQPKGQPRRTVDYRNLGAEELGSIYESLLELVPRRDTLERTFTLATLAGNERKTSGSYYTPSALIDLVLDEALDPLLDNAERARDPEAALLDLTVCDPACGSGHFLVAAARRIAERLATARTAETDPTPGDVQAALHDVVQRCIYGVDLNPMAAELAKVSLWLEALQPGRPLTFLDAHIKVGNSLLGTTPALIAGGIPDAAYAVLDGDDKGVTGAMRKQNRADLAGQDSLFGGSDEAALTNTGLRTALAAAGTTTATSLADVHEAKRRYTAYEASPELRRERLRADAWCAAFVQHKRPGSVPITTATVQAAEADALTQAETEVVQSLAAQFRFFHWHLEFPDVFEVSSATATEPNGWRAGFTVMIGNPPWERIKLQEQEFFAQRDPDVAEAPNSAARKTLIKALADSNPTLAAEWRAAGRESEATSHFLRRSSRYPLCGVGDINTYSIFAEQFRSSIAFDGRMGIITPTGLATDATTAAFFADTVRHKRLAAFYDFDNEAKIFPGVHHAYRFSVSCLTGGHPVEHSRLSFLTRHVIDAVTTRFALSADEILLLNPNTGTMPMFRTRRDAEITIGIYTRHPVLINETAGTNPWGLRFATLFHMANDSGLFRTAEALEDSGALFDGWSWHKGVDHWLPLYEAKMLSHYDHRFSTYENATQAQLNVGSLPRLTEKDHDDPEHEPLARYWVAESDVNAAIGDEWSHAWLLGLRRLTRSSDQRTLIPYVFPLGGVGDNSWIAFTSSRTVTGLLAAWSSPVCDYVIRQKLSGTTLSAYIVEQLACPAPEAFDGELEGVATPCLKEWVEHQVLELTYTSWRMSPYAAYGLQLPDGAEPGPPFRWIPARREILRAELDAAMFHLYGLARDEVDHVLDSFFVVRKYEERDHGEFRTKRLILEIYDAMADAAARGTAYRSTLNPPAGEGPRHPARDVRGSDPA